MGLSKEKKKLFRQLKTKKGREKKKLFLGEGLRLIETALSLGGKIHSLYLARDFSPPPSLATPLERASFPIFTLSLDDFQEISTTSSPQGILAVFYREFASPKEIRQARDPLVLALDSIQDGGNLGTLFRTAHSLGISCVLVGKNTVDPFDPKVVRSSVGSLFGLKLAPFLELSEVLAQCKQDGYTLITTTPQGGQTPENISFSPPGVVIFGNEGGGIDQTILDEAHLSLTIPLVPKAQSLNVATSASILLYFLSRHLGLNPS